MRSEALESAAGSPMTRRQVMAVAAGSAGVLLGGVAVRADADDAAAKPVRRFDVVVVGGGPAGLSAALVLGRACRKVLVCDAGPGRNAPAAGVHGFLSQDGTPPAELRRMSWEQLKRYDVEHQLIKVTDARKVDAGFAVTLEGGEMVTCRKLVLGTGMVDDLPEISGLRELWGKAVIHCPYCHGWEFRGRPWAFLVPPEAAVEVATLLLGWTKQLTLLSHGPARLSAEHRAWLAKYAVEIVEQRIDRIEGDGERLRAIHLDGGKRLEREVLFVRGTIRQASDLPQRLGCTIIDQGPMAGMVRTEPTGATQVDGLYVVGDASGIGVTTVTSAVAEGATVGGVANMAMLKEENR